MVVPLPPTPKTAKAPYTYYATIDCGAGRRVARGTTCGRPLADLESGKTYKPCLHVAVGEFSMRGQALGKHAVEAATRTVSRPTVTVKNA